MPTISTGGHTDWPRLADTIPPYINLNGETAESWMKKTEKVLDALEDAIEALAECRAHGRDYQTVGENVRRAAETQHERRMFCLLRVKVEIDTIRKKIVEQMEKGAR